jgi:glutathione S-transferase
MKLYNSIGPNPKVVRMYLAERGLDIALHEIDIMGGENRRADYLKLNPAGQIPALELDSGEVISEITAICEYLEETNGASPLIGESPEQRAHTRMWIRRIDHGILENLANGFRYAEGVELFRERMRLIPQAADDLKSLAQEKISWLDDQMEGKQFICGDHLNLADIMLYAFLEFGTMVGQPLNTDNERIIAWYERMAARPSAAA